MIQCENYTLLAKLARELSDIRLISYLEVGTNEGHSADAMLQDGNGIAIAVLVDSWGKECGGTGRGNPDHVVKLLGDRMNRVIILTGTSREVLPRLTHPFDLVFVDAGHSHQECLEDMTDGLRLLAPGGIMCVDDLDHPQHSYLRQTVTDFAAANNLIVTIHNVHTGVAELRRKA